MLQANTAARQWVFGDVSDGSHKTASNRCKPSLSRFGHIGISLLGKSSAVLLTVALKITILTACVACLAFLARVVLAGSAVFDVLVVIARVYFDFFITADDWTHIRPA